MSYIEEILAAGRVGRGYGTTEYSGLARSPEEMAALRSTAKVTSLGRPEQASTHLSTTALSKAERTTLTTISGKLAAELLRVERVHSSPMWQLNHGVSGTTAASDVDRLRRQARAELSKAAGERG